MSDSDWRKKEAGLKEVIARYPQASPLVILKTDMQRRGITFTDAALSKVDPAIHQVQYATCTKEHIGGIPSSLLMRDGTTVLAGAPAVHSKRDPYVIDADGDRIVVTDGGEIIDEVFYWEKPAYYDKLTSTGKPMWQVVSARPQRLDIYPHHYCEFWNTAGEGCKFCAATAISKKSDEKNHLNTSAEIAEVVREAVKQPGRFANIFLTGGTTLSGKELLDDEVDAYIEILQAVGEIFGNKKFPSQLIGTAFSKKQLERLYENTGLMSYTADLEVLSEKKFKWICPGKANKIGYEE